MVLLILSGILYCLLPPSAFQFFFIFFFLFYAAARGVEQIILVLQEGYCVKKSKNNENKIVYR